MKTVSQGTPVMPARGSGSPAWAITFFATGALTAAFVAALLRLGPLAPAAGSGVTGTAASAAPATAPAIAAAPVVAPLIVPAPATLPAPVPPIPTCTARRQALDVTIPLLGECRAVQNVEIRSTLEGMTTILWVVPEGSRVQAGEVVMRLATTGLNERIQTARINVQDAAAARTAAEVALSIQEMENCSALKTAQAGVESAQMEYEQFDKGAAQVQAETLKIAEANAQADLERKIKDRKAAEELARKGFVPDNDLLDARTAERDARQKLEAQHRNLEIWTTLTEPQQRKALQRKCDDAAADLDLVQKKNQASLVIKQTGLRAREFALGVVNQQLAALESQLASATIKAPAAGLVLYPSSEAGGGAVAAGETVGPNQVLLRVADTAQMRVTAFVDEDAIGRVHAGQTALVAIDALAGQLVRGKVHAVAAFPDSGKRHTATGAKTYRTQIELVDAPADLQPDMSAHVQILSKHLDNIIAVPQQAVFNEDAQAYVYVGSAENFEKRAVKTGLASVTHVQIMEGVHAGEHVLLARPPAPAAATTAATAALTGPPVAGANAN